MKRGWFSALLQVTAFTLALVAISQELEKPKDERKWHGNVAGFVPYDFRRPTCDRFMKSYWNPDDSRILTRPLFGVGWGINLHALRENLRFVKQQEVSE